MCLLLGGGGGGGYPPRGGLRKKNSRELFFPVAPCVCPLNFACGATGSVRSANYSKSRASFIKVIAPGSLAHCKARSQHSRSVMKRTSQGQVHFVGCVEKQLGLWRDGVVAPLVAGKGMP